MLIGFVVVVVVGVNWDGGGMNGWMDGWMDGWIEKNGIDILLLCSYYF